MITFEDAYRIVMENAVSMNEETIPFRDSLGRVLALDLESDIDMPPFNKATMDGFACRKEDLGSDLKIIETIPAGKSPEKIIGKGECSRIMTGAAIPAGADCVIIIEETEAASDGKIRFTGTFTKENISIRGEDIRIGDLVLRKGKLITPQDIAVMASSGHTMIKVRKRPVAGIISTGSEIVEPHLLPGPSKIRNSNSSQLEAQVDRAGATPVYYGIARDNEEETFQIISKALSSSDLVILTGGVSMGDYDFVPDVLKRAGVSILFSRVAVQPGKPTTFGLSGRKLVFGLPGNPVSCFLQFELLVRPLIQKMMGSYWKPLTLKLPLKEKISRRSSDRLGLLPVCINEEGTVTAVEYHGSAHITAFPYTDGILFIEKGQSILKKGSIVNVRLI